ncbi:hypothetical protein AMS68_002207 [Peltaster fructicola]|uniref:Major facilitator superfamily (MFS) profile domain-containing protein n=1 Tax=Peltaster fructicola TaxID=286661 RepID=A0A6H0XQD5_9PEZI|nr:hypothetical protein AMS68_002207 [Peltaster fructicola]
MKLNISQLLRQRILLVHAPKYVLYSMLISFGGLNFGLDTGCIGPITTMPQFVDYFGSLSPTVHGLVVSSILIPAAVASFFAGGLSDTLGRPRTVGSGLLVFGLGCALEASAQNLGMLFAGRIITGLGEGVYMSAMSIYICEIAPPKERGMLCSIQQFLTSLGICAGYFLCYGTVESGKSSTLAWRLPFAIQSFLALTFSVVAFRTLPQSPRWLEMKGRRAEAESVWNELGITSAERERSQQDTDVASLSEALVTSHVPSIQPPQRIKVNPLAIFHPSVLSRTLLGAALMTFQQLSGIDGVLYYAPLLFQAAGLSSSTSSFLASGLSALLMLLITIPAFLYADKWGRRTSVLSGGIIISTTMLLIGTLYAAGAVHGDHGVGRWAVIVLIYIFALAFSATWAVSVRVYSSEIQPVHTRAPATSFAQAMNWLTNWTVAFITPILLSEATYSIYFLFGGCTVLAVLLSAFAMPETKGRSLEDIDLEFERRRVHKVLNVTGVTRRLARRRRQVEENEIELMPVSAGSM